MSTQTQTGTMGTPPSDGAALTANPGIRFVIVLAVTLLVMAVLSFDYLKDPYVWTDDYKSVFGQEDVYLRYAATEGRWLNYLWMLRDFFFDPTLLTGGYLLSLCFYASFFATAYMRRSAHLWPVIALSVAIAIHPSLIFSSHWSGTHFLGLALLAVGAGVIGNTTGKTQIWAYVVFGAVVFQSYPIYPLLLFPLLVKRPVRNMQEALRLLIISAMPVFLGFGMVPVLNGLVTGSHKLMLSQQRMEESEIQIGFWQTVIEKVFAGPRFLYEGFYTTALQSMPGTIALLALFVVILYYLYRNKALSAVLVPFIALFGFLCAVHYASNIWIPPRTSSYLWLFVLIGFGQAILVAKHSTVARRVLAVGLIAIIGYQANVVRKDFAYHDVWMAETIKIAKALEGAQTPIVIRGSPWHIPSAVEKRVWPSTLKDRLTVLGLEEVLHCRDREGLCDNLPRAEEVIPEGSTDYEILNVNGVTILMFPPWIGPLPH